MQSQPEILSTTFRLGPGFWAEIPTRHQRALIDQATERTRAALHEHEVAPPDSTVLRRISMAAMEATVLLFQAADHDPSRAELHAFFDDFVLRAVTGGGENAQASF